jgi:hypothetical protein
MRKDVTFVIIAIGILAAATLSYLRPESATLKRKPFPKPTTARVFRIPAVPSAAVPSPTAPSAVAGTVAERSAPYPEELCAFFRALGRGPANEAETRRLLDFLSENWPHDGSFELLSALREGDWNEVAELGRTGVSPAAEELGLLARLNLFEPGGDSATGVASWVAPPGPRDFDQIEEMKRNDPGNSFWPLIEATLLEGTGREEERLLRIAEAASLPVYRNPVSSFYAQTQRTALADRDDRKYLAYTTLYSEAPTLSFKVLQSLFRSTGKSSEEDELLKWIGKTMELSQDAGDSAVYGPRVDGIQGNFFDSWMGRVLTRKATGDKSPSRPAYDEMRKRFSVGEEFGIGPAISGGCDGEKLHSLYETRRNRVFRDD